MATLASGASDGAVPSTPSARRWLLAWLAIATAVYLACTVPFLDDFPLLSGDDAWVMSVSDRLARTGRLGTELFTGFFRADEVYFINLPAQHLWQSSVFTVAGAGVRQARLVSIAAAVALVWVVGWLAFRWYGLAVAIVATALLVFWHSGLIGGTIPILQAGRTARYDLMSVATVWIAIAFLDRLARLSSAPAVASGFSRTSGFPRRAVAAAACGVACGLAALTQFHGAFVVPLAAFWWWSLWRRRLVPASSGAVLLGGFALIAGPYAVYVLSNWDAFVGQQSIHAARFGSTSPGFYLQSLGREWQRFVPGPNRPGAFWLFLLGTGPALWHLARRAVGGHEPGDRLLLATVAIFWPLLGLLEPVKAPLYAVVLVPSICLMLALGAADAFTWATRSVRSRAGQMLLPGLLVTALLALIADGVSTYASTVERARQAPPQEAVTAALQSAVPHGAVVAAFEAFWWPLKGANQVRSWGALWSQWRTIPGSDSDASAFHSVLTRAGIEYLVLSRPDQTYLASQPAALRAQSQRLIDHCTRPVATVSVPGYDEARVLELIDCPR
jgi:4-amino-4-deoxy-L-arabinose transferase-like glycosyltransferase